MFLFISDKQNRLTALLGSSLAPIIDPPTTNAVFN